MRMVCAAHSGGCLSRSCNIPSAHPALTIADNPSGSSTHTRPNRVDARSEAFLRLERNSHIDLSRSSDHLPYGVGLKRMAYQSGGTLVALVGGGLVLGMGPAHAADLLTLSPDVQPSAFLPLPAPTREADSFQARLGVFAHSVGATEAGGVDANVELLLPRLPNDLPEQYKFLVPRPQFGAMINTAGKTSITEQWTALLT
jgi:hypothetical protein